jgi:hypothetical protein
MNKSYHEIRHTCQLVDFQYKLAGNSGLWVEVYQDDTHEYRALFPKDTTLVTDLPITITKHEIAT